MLVMAFARESMLRLASAMDAQQHLEVDIGGLIHLGARIHNFSYKLLGPLGPFEGLQNEEKEEKVDGQVDQKGKIPGIIHQIWIGEGEPSQLIDSWRMYAMQEGFEHRLWRNGEDVIAAAAPKISKALLAAWQQSYEAEESRRGRSDLLRVFLLYTFGGLYSDSDAFWLQPLAEMSETVDFVAGWVSERQPWLNGALMASVPKAQVGRC